MKTKILIISLILTSFNLKAQDASGDWNGALKVGGMQLRLIFHVNKTANGYSATMDSPDQGQKNIPMSKTSFENKILIIEMAAARISYSGMLVTTDSISGTFSQGGQNFPMNLTRKAIQKQEVKHVQEPQKPYPYYSEELSFENKKAGITLAGTLTLPKKAGKFPVVVMITGSGPQNRDEELLGHKPFLVIADYLTLNDIGVLRFDDRGCFASKGDFKTATSFDFATDVEAAVEYLKTRKETDTKHIGLIGHSEGGIIAPIVAAKYQDVNFIVLMAGTAVSGGNIMLKQQEDIGNAMGMSKDDIQKTKEINSEVFKIMSQSTDTAKLRSDLTAYIKSRIKDFPKKDIPKDMTEDELAKVQANNLLSPWMLNFICYNPQNTLEKLKCAVLALNGEKDLQVSSKINLPAIENALKKAGNTHYTIKELPGLNHLFQECKTGAPAEYAEIEQTISPLALETMTNWIKTVCK